MTNKSPTSAPLFGAPTPSQVEDVKQEITAFTAKLVQDVVEARKIFNRAEPQDSPEPDAPA